MRTDRIIKRGVVGLIGDSDREREIQKQCPYCEKAGLHHQLGPRLDYNLHDADKWLQCYHCGNTVETKDVREQGRLTSRIEKAQFADAKQITSIHRVKPKDRGTRRAYDYIHDEEVKKEVRKGGKLITYSEK